MTIKNLTETYEQLCRLHPDQSKWEYETYPESADGIMELATAAVVHEAARLTPDAFNANLFLSDFYHQKPDQLPELIAMMAMSLSAKDRSMLREMFGILELTQRS